MFWIYRRPEVHDLPREWEERRSTAEGLGLSKESAQKTTVLLP